MVAVPRSKGCLVCRKRSVKCDEVRPGCSQCRRGGRKCSGYDLPMTFISQHPELDKPKKASNIGQNRPSKQQPASNAASLALIMPQQHPIDRLKIQRSIYCPALNRVQLVNSFVNNLFPPRYLVPQLSFFADWLRLIPKYMAKSRLLDYAAQCLALGFFGRETANTASEQNGRGAYSIALGYLSRAVEDVEVGLSTETLCATMLLSFYEIYMRTQNTSWVTHAGGAGRLMQIRGAHRHKEGFDYIMFLGFRGIIIAEAVASETSCFLDSEDWRSIVASSEIYRTSSETFRFHNGFSNLIASVPAIAVRLNAATRCDTSIISRTSTIIDGTSLRDDFRRWHLRFTSAFATCELSAEEYALGKDHTTALASYDPETVWMAAWLCAYYACLIMLNTRISQLSDIDTSVENSELIRKLCVAVSHCSRAGNSGGQCLAFALPVALSLCKDELNGWVQESLASVGGLQGVSEAQISMLRSFVEVKL
ncbi:hypothetical protein BKA65DRAFT_505459 [Rhexocercosporidium sp. MPI-PUGE-AT-0058]|nr:hypothetical protein BKA65DRAFT_505459 [Rhexocercosporidium sp. MPI-PUGE-AT-0058]